MSLFTLLAKGLAALAILGRVQAATSYPNPGACSGDCWTHDPALFQGPDGSYFRLSTGSLIGIYKAPAIEGPWTKQGSVIQGASTINLKGNNDLWAPDVQWFDGTYYCYYTVSSFGSQASAIGVATSKTLEAGSWTDLGATGVASQAGDAYNAIDANVFVADAATMVMTFGSFWADLFQVPMSSMTAAAAAASGGGNNDAPTNIALNTSSATQAVEAGFVYAHGGSYFLFFSSGACCGYDVKRPVAGAEYQIMVCRSSSLAGPFVDADGESCLAGGGTLVLQSHGTVYGPGGQGVYTHSQYGPVMYYHYVDTTIGFKDGDKKFGWNALDFSSGWPVAK